MAASLVLRAQILHAERAFSVRLFATGRRLSTPGECYNLGEGALFVFVAECSRPGWQPRGEPLLLLAARTLLKRHRPKGPYRSDSVTRDWPVDLKYVRWGPG